MIPMELELSRDNLLYARKFQWPRGKSRSWYQQDTALQLRCVRACGPTTRRCGACPIAGYFTSSTLAAELVLPPQLERAIAPRGTRDLGRRVYRGYASQKFVP